MLSAPTLAEIESVVHGRIRALLAERVGEVGLLSGSEKLNATLGLSSLDLAFLVAELEAELRIDPFVKLVPGAPARRRGQCDRHCRQARSD
jgi:hypothetical protein